MRRHPVLFAALVLIGAALVIAARGQEPAGLAERFEALFTAQDHAGAVALLREQEGRVLPFVDGFLEGSLAKIEDGSAEPGSAEIRALHARALFGARAADEAFGRVLFGDYAASFVGWDADQRARFRAGQKAFGAHRAAMQSKTYDEALEAATACREAAEPLGDWWGTAMGLGGEGAALLALDRAEEALVPLARARHLNHELGLLGAEYGTLRRFADALVAAGRTERARVALEHALALAERTGDDAGREALAERLAALPAR